MTSSASTRFSHDAGSLTQLRRILAEQREREIAAQQVELQQLSRSNPGPGGSTYRPAGSSPVELGAPPTSAAELQQSASTGVTTPGVGSPMPWEAGFQNGRIPTDQLVPIGIGSHKMWSPAAAAFQQMVAAAAKDGVRFGMTDSYRSYEAQVDVARRKGLYSQGGLAAEPGTSNHGWGMALDLDLDDRAQQWLQANAARFGFKTIPREPWHWEWSPDGASAPPAGGGSGNSSAAGSGSAGGTGGGGTSALRSSAAGGPQGSPSIARPGAGGTAPAGSSSTPQEISAPGPESSGNFEQTFFAKLFQALMEMTEAQRQKLAENLARNPEFAKYAKQRLGTNFDPQNVPPWLLAEFAEIKSGELLEIPEGVAALGTISQADGPALLDGLGSMLAGSSSPQSQTTTAPITSSDANVQRALDLIATQPEGQALLRAAFDNGFRSVGVDPSLQASGVTRWGTNARDIDVRDANSPDLIATLVHELGHAATTSDGNSLREEKTIDVLGSQLQERLLGRPQTGGHDSLDLNAYGGQGLPADNGVDASLSAIGIT